MANSKIGIIITREFNERVRKKSFIVTTILMPVLMIGLMVAPALIMRYSQGNPAYFRDRRERCDRSPAREQRGGGL